ncbi:PREDICTED: transcription factor TGA2.2 isoform X2 [Tarenaya hassleriana]|uniref:transcription factor TGA2.2 isoform X2 n=1 Tax=Tarenaya hassleriana TaxID=28532 RepID=UPI00053C6217|nr:PREDICTED: transcription factor TGA2.2 isoform X2 [Tarenaya hassleriana]
MANHRISDATNHHQLPYSLLHGLSNPPPGFSNQEGSTTFDFGELEEAIVLQGVKFRNDEAKPRGDSGRGAAATTLEMFPSWPMRAHQTPPRGNSKSRGESTDSGSANFSGSQQTESPMSSKKPSHGISPELRRNNLMLNNSNNNTTNVSDASRTGLASTSQTPAPPPRTADDKRKATTSGKQLDAKTLRRLAQNREAARKSRLRKKAYVQQLESSRIKLTQLEQELQRARSQGLLLGGGCGPAGPGITPGAAIFDMEYGRWLEEENRHMSEIRTGVQAHLSDSDLRVTVDGYIAHFDELFRLKAAAAKSDVFHLVTGTWMSPAERCFIWIAGFRPSDLIKMVVGQMELVTEQQMMGIYSLQHSSQQAEEALSQGLEQLQHSLIDHISSLPLLDDFHQMALAIAKLSNLEGFVRQADNLRQQTIHQLRRILTVRQAARCFLIIGEYYGRLRALSSLWLSRPREGLISDEAASCQTTTDLQMVQSSRNHFSNF